MKFTSRSIVSLSVAMLLPVTISGHDTQSGPLARELTQRMAKQRLGTVAAKDPATSDRFVAAMVFPEVQLLVVTARVRGAIGVAGGVGQETVRTDLRIPSTSCRSG
jgi:hypothetical protein